MTMTERPFAIVTGASSGIGYELAKRCAEHGYDLLRRPLGLLRRLEQIRAKDPFQLQTRSTPRCAHSLASESIAALFLPTSPSTLAMATWLGWMVGRTLSPRRRRFFEESSSAAGVRWPPRTQSPSAMAD
jgi:hypothetical protein